jgi:hypothetical protein
MPQMNFDLEDGQDPVSFVLSKADGDRFMAFMEDCTDAIKRRDQLVEELEAAQDYAEDRARLLDMVREKLGVPSEPHQGMDGRILEAAERAPQGTSCLACGSVPGQYHSPECPVVNAFTAGRIPHAGEEK